MPEKRNNSACPEGQQPPVASVEATLMLKYYSTWMDRGAREAVEHQKKNTCPTCSPLKESNTYAPPPHGRPRRTAMRIHTRILSTVFENHSKIVAYHSNFHAKNSIDLVCMLIFQKFEFSRQKSQN